MSINILNHQAINLIYQQPQIQINIKEENMENITRKGTDGTIFNEKFRNGELVEREEITKNEDGELIKYLQRGKFAGEELIEGIKIKSNKYDEPFYELRGTFRDGKLVDGEETKHDYSDSNSDHTLERWSVANGKALTNGEKTIISYLYRDKLPNSREERHGIFRGDKLLRGTKFIISDYKTEYMEDVNWDRNDVTFQFYEGEFDENEKLAGDDNTKIIADLDGKVTKYRGKFQDDEIVDGMSSHLLSSAKKITYHKHNSNLTDDDFISPDDSWGIRLEPYQELFFRTHKNGKSIAGLATYPYKIMEGSEEKNYLIDIDYGIINKLLNDPTKIPDSFDDFLNMEERPIKIRDITNIAMEEAVLDKKLGKDVTAEKNFDMIVDSSKQMLEKKFFDLDSDEGFNGATAEIENSLLLANIKNIKNLPWMRFNAVPYDRANYENAEIFLEKVVGLTIKGKPDVSKNNTINNLISNGITHLVLPLSIDNGKPGTGHAITLLVNLNAVENKKEKDAFYLYDSSGIVFNGEDVASIREKIKNKLVGYKQSTIPDEKINITPDEIDAVYDKCFEGTNFMDSRGGIFYNFKHLNPGYQRLGSCGFNSVAAAKAMIEDKTMTENLMVGRTKYPKLELELQPKYNHSKFYDRPENLRIISANISEGASNELEIEVINTLQDMFSDNNLMRVGFGKCTEQCDQDEHGKRSRWYKNKRPFAAKQVVQEPLVKNIKIWAKNIIQELDLMRDENEKYNNPGFLKSIKIIMADNEISNSLKNENERKNNVKQAMDEFEKFKKEEPEKNKFGRLNKLPRIKGF